MKKIKLFFKKALIIYLIVLVLLPSLFTGVALAEEVDMQLTPERAGNYAANFAINFYENWSSINVVKNGKTTSAFSGEIMENAAKIWEKVKSDNPNYGNTSPSPQTIVEMPEQRIVNIDCSGYVASVIYATTKDEKFKNSFHCSTLYGEFVNGGLRQKYEQMGWEIRTNKECIESR